MCFVLSCLHTWFLKKVVASAEFNQSMYTYVTIVPHALLELELKKDPQNVVLGTTIVHGSCSADAIKREVLRTMT